ncbi:MAG: biotin--[acetyl-CoA-carboxylase] ligase, partial [Bacteroidales bacterium]|nr:biotin--[acetyl-CoA-carboxylase] ligase [Bacteroidales bacterium]
MKVGSHIIDLDTVSSTNNYALALLEEEKPVDGTVITAGYQSGGRGQEGNSWESEKGRNLLFTIIL